MLTDIFAERYSNLELWENNFVSAKRTKLLVQLFRVLSEQVCPYYKEENEEIWERVHNDLSMELGRVSLLPKKYSSPNLGVSGGKLISSSDTYFKICRQWILDYPDEYETWDEFMKERISFIELGFRYCEEKLKAQIASTPSNMLEAYAERIGGREYVKIGSIEAIRAMNARKVSDFNKNIEEINERFIKAGCNLNYHNGFIQISSDELSEKEIEQPFWNLVSAKIWQNVDHDMKEAIDRRDTNAKDPAFYAVRALESAIKIISGEKGWTTGKEKGANNFIERLASNGIKFIEPWEADVLKDIFTKIRNPVAHGPGSEEFMNLSPQQTDWVIDNCISWIKSLVRRM